MSNAEVGTVPATEAALLREDRDGVVTLTLNRPQARNALSIQLMTALQDEIDAIGGDPATRVVVLGARGPAFCSGHDLRELRAIRGQEAYEALFAQCSRLMVSLTRLPQPVIARVQGVATAAGCQLVATCDLALASRRATFATPGVNLGLFCSTPMVALSRSVGPKHAMEMLLTGDPVSATRACEMGLLNRVVEDEELDGVVDELARKVAQKSRHSIATGKGAFYRQIELDLEDAYEYASRVMAENMLAADACEGIGAFLEKRPPRWPDVSASKRT